MPTFVGPQPGKAGQAQLYAVNLPSSTIQLVSRALDGNPASHGAAESSSLSSDGARLVFLSASDDMVIGDSNSAVDMFSSDFADSGVPLAQSLPADFEAARPSVDQRLRATYRKLRGGVLAIDVVVPAAGKVEATATARLGKRRRMVARARATAKRAETITLKLKPSRRAARAARRTDGLEARVAIAFKRRGAVSKSSVSTIPVVFKGRRGGSR
jgi:hypothetical protein